jgi:hypothetical protein
MAFDPAGTEQIAGQIRAALQSADLLGYRDLLDPNVTWGAPDDMNSGCRNLRRSDGSLPLRPHRLAGQGWRTASMWAPRPTDSRPIAGEPTPTSMGPDMSAKASASDHQRDWSTPAGIRTQSHYLRPL